MARIWAVMALTGRHQYQVLTKRPKRLATMLNDPEFAALVALEATDVIGRTAPQFGRWRLDLGGERLAGDSGRGGGWTVTKAGRQCVGAAVAAAERVGGHFHRVG